MRMPTGNLAALGVGTIISVAGTLIWPEYYDFSQNTVAAIAPATPELDDKEKDISVTTTQTPVDTVEGEDPVSLNRAFRFAVWFSLLLTLVLIILVCTFLVLPWTIVHRHPCRFRCRCSSAATSTPRPVLPLGLLSASSGCSSVSVANGLCAGLPLTTSTAFGAVVVYPVYESRIELGALVNAIITDIKGKRSNTEKL